MEYFTLEKMSPILRDFDWPARPSNGALMIVAGAALQPERLIISGMDLFLHPDGRYRGDIRSNNQYTRTYRRNVDVEIIRRALQDYHGESIILSDALRDSLSAMERVTECR